MLSVYNIYRRSELGENYTVQRKYAVEVCEVVLYCIHHIFHGGFIFANFASRVLCANLTTRKKIYLWSRRMNATCVRNTVVQYTVHVQGTGMANFASWRWVYEKYLISASIALLLNHEFNHPRKCLEVPIREKLDLQNIWRIQYSFANPAFFSLKFFLQIAFLTQEYSGTSL